MAVCVCERYLKRQIERVVSLFGQEGEGRDAGTDGAEKETRVFVCFVCMCQKPFFFFLADIKYPQTSSVIQIQPSEPNVQQQA